MLTKHISLETARHLLPQLGWRALTAREQGAPVVKMTRANRIEDLENTDKIVEEHERECQLRATSTGAKMGRLNQRLDDWDQFVESWKDLNRPRGHPTMNP